MGCSPDCLSDETCGNGHVDPECGETCDDGNQNPADGCASCQTITWSATAVIGGNTSATGVALSFPLGVAVDRAGNLYIADAFHAQVRRVDTTGVITTIAGTGVPGDVLGW